MKAIEVGAWYVPQRGVKTPRWVLSMTPAQTRKTRAVICSKGGVRHFSCLITTFKRWIKRTNAHKATPERAGIPDPFPKHITRNP